MFGCHAAHRKKRSAIAIGFALQATVKHDFKSCSTTSETTPKVTTTSNTRRHPTLRCHAKNVNVGEKLPEKRHQTKNNIERCRNRLGDGIVLLDLSGFAAIDIYLT